VCMFDVTIGDFRFPSALDKEYGIKQGLELVGGSLIEFKPQEGVTPTSAQMDTVQSIIRSRLDSQAYYDATVTVQKDNSVRIEIPDVEDPSEAVSILGSTAKLTFRDYQGNILMEGTNEYIANAQMQYGQTSQANAASYYVSLELTSAGREAFKKATQTVLNYQANNNNYIGIYLDEKAVSKPSVSQVIDSDKCVITGSFDKEGASTLAAQIRSGQLPFKLEVGQVQSVGPTLGEEAMSKSLIAGGIGLILVLLFMIGVYRLSGVIASVSLCAYTALVVIILVRLQATLTLAGIAGIILSIGMAVDADCIIFERLKEELRTGKTLGASVDSAFHRALTAIIDANVTTLIAALVLYIYGTGSIRGFAVTLTVGTLVSMFTAIILTKFLMIRLIRGFEFKNTWLFGVRRRAIDETV
ncbi:MAG: protein translocase subunit SecD, partial [Bacillota bacterium]|nr:protein translocase subunit SecD [Bacillota bacterium]